MKILFELTKKILLILFATPTKNFVSSAKKKKWISKLKLQNYCTIKEKILLIEIKLKKFCKKYKQYFCLHATKPFSYFN